LSDRSLFLHLPPIAPAKRLREELFWQLFNQDYPMILGGLLDAVAGGLRELPSVEPAELPRMADFAAFAEAVGRNLGWPAGTVLSNYNDNRCEAAVTHIEESPVASFLLEWAHELNDWSGTPTELLAQLTTLSVDQANCAWHRFNEAIARAKADKDPARQKQLARELALPIRQQIIAHVADLHRCPLATVTTPGEMGTVTNWQQQNLPALVYQPGEELAKVLGERLPAAGTPSSDYPGRARRFVPVVRTALKGRMCPRVATEAGCNSDVRRRGRRRT